MGEIWRHIQGYEGLYEVSNNGVVRALDRIVFDKNHKHYRKHGKIKIFLPSNGYVRVELYRNCEFKRIFVHRLVGFAFIPNPDNKPFINHKNGIRNDNRVENLKWCTHSENQKYTADVFKKGLTKIHQFTMNGEFIRSYESIKLASGLTGISNAQITTTLRRNHKSAGGYRWEYADPNGFEKYKRRRIK